MVPRASTMMIVYYSWSAAITTISITIVIIPTFYDDAFLEAFHYLFVVEHSGVPNTITPRESQKPPAVTKSIR